MPQSHSRNSGSDDPAAVLDAMRAHWDGQAATYDQGMDRIERAFIGDGRSWVCGQARGRTLEVAVGTGRNLELYGDDVELTGVDLSPRMLQIARRRAAGMEHVAALREADAEHLPFPDGHFDTVVATLSLCSVPDVGAAVAEMRRVLRPGGRLLLLDHVRPTVAPLRWALRGLEWITARTQPGSGERFLRRPLEQVREHGFTIETSERSKAGAIERVSALKPA
ncbi:class I SAM-dependent methyltransferase [Streptomonospora sp. PA3]|uniref:class I SAM-dependent methyltransferase n=1 Tax=Streptomonospora sp. PA3 TaxID=2607326 RepID=UPI0012DDD887|nr:class I SAM-dependent methyltransferase [Streptomonospora sp. PA3]MUL41168.1 class I SAM-dependent methyltransferase [Streptomonospora sp. PA3]